MNNGYGFRVSRFLGFSRLALLLCLISSRNRCDFVALMVVAEPELEQQDDGIRVLDKKQESDAALSIIKSPYVEKSHFLPVFRSGSDTDQGPKSYMEDEHICVNHLHEQISTARDLPSPGAFYGVFDGHGGTDAASFSRKNILKFIVEDTHFPSGIKKAVRNAFVKADHAFADSTCPDNTSGTTVLTTLILGRNMLIANGGDSRAVLGKRCRAVELSKDHKPNCTSERLRIEKMGGVVCDGYLNGQLSVARALRSE
ncbi:hypothetical protein Droror1_Dr00025867 [Drosera rotundifolia]